MKGNEEDRRLLGEETERANEGESDEFLVDVLEGNVSESEMKAWY